MDWADLALQRARQLVDLGRLDEALTALGPATATPGAAAEAQLLSARCLLALGRPREAEKAAVSALRIMPSDSRAHSVRGAAQFNLEQTRRALRSAQKAAELDPLSVHAQYLKMLCYVRFGFGYRGRARAAGQHALRLDPNSPLAYETAGTAEAASGRRHRAVAERYFRAGLAIDPQDQDLALKLGDVLRRARRHREAADTYLAAAAIDPTDGRARSRLARLGGPGIAGVGVLGKLAAVNNGGRLLSAHGHALAIAGLGTLALLLGAGLTTGLKLLRNRILPDRVRAGLRGEYVNSALAWVLVAGMLLTIVTLEAAIAPHHAGTPRWAAIPFAATAGLFFWISAHYRVGPRREWSDLRARFHLDRRTSRGWRG